MSHREKHSPVKIGDILKSQYEVTTQLGKGGFGAVFEVVDKNTKSTFALKIEMQRPKNDEPGLELEIGVLKKLQQCQHVCKYYDEGKIGPFHYLVMQLAGKNLSDIRKSLPDCHFTVGSCVRISVQCLNSIEAVHGAGLLHRDIKPANFAMGRTSEDSRVVYILDFGLVRRYRMNDGTGRVRPARARAGFRGTVRYASINAHRNIDLGRRDDMWSWLYMIIETYKGELPWRLETDKARVGELKASIGRPQLMFRMEREFHQLHECIQALDYATEPDYALYRNLLNSVLYTKKLPLDGPFDWEEGGAYYQHAHKITHQPFAQQMQSLGNVVQERFENEEEDSIG